MLTKRLTLRSNMRLSYEFELLPHFRRCVKPLGKQVRESPTLRHLNLQEVDVQIPLSPSGDLKTAAVAAEATEVKTLSRPVLGQVSACAPSLGFFSPLPKHRGAALVLNSVKRLQHSPSRWLAVGSSLP